MVGRKEASVGVGEPVIRKLYQTGMGGRESRI